MPIPKSAHLALIIELGNQVDDFKEDAEKDALRCEGYDKCLREFEEGLKSIFERVDVELNEGKFSETSEPLVTARFIKQFLLRVQHSVGNLKLRNEKTRVLAEGRVLALTTTLDAARKIVTKESAQLEALQKAVTAGVVVEEAPPAPVHEGDPKYRPVGVHPGNPLQARRAQTEVPATRARKEPGKPVIKSHPKVKSKKSAP